jgi:hypothetical protein
MVNEAASLLFSTLLIPIKRHVKIYVGPTSKDLPIHYSSFSRQKKI